MQIEIKAGQRVILEIKDNIIGIDLGFDTPSPTTTTATTRVAKHAKRGPKSLPPRVGKSTDYHQPILTALIDGPLTAEQLRHKLGVNKSDNTFSWALVELQNEGCSRGRYRPKTGPLAKTDTDQYILRK